MPSKKKSSKMGAMPKVVRTKKSTSSKSSKPKSKTKKY